MCQRGRRRGVRECGGKPSRFTEYCRVEVIGRAMARLAGKNMTQRHIRILSREVLANIDERGQADKLEQIVARAIEEFGDILGIPDGAAANRH